MDTLRKANCTQNLIFYLHYNICGTRARFYFATKLWHANDQNQSHFQLTLAKAYDHTPISYTHKIKNIVSISTLEHGDYFFRTFSYFLLPSMQKIFFLLGNQTVPGW